MPDGEVGSGHQNSWERDGSFLTNDTQSKYPNDRPKFRKGRINHPTDRNQSECWSAGTPITWDHLIQNTDGTVKIRESGMHAITTIVRVKATDEGVEMLTSTDPNGKTEYHPLITFFNEVMATILNEDQDMLKGIDTPAEAIRVWEFLKATYDPAIRDRISVGETV